MNKYEASDWHWCMSVHEDLWKLGLSHSEIIAYTYLNSFCHKTYAISLTIMARRIHMDTKRLKRAVDMLESRHLVQRGPFTKGKPRTIMVIPRRSKSWGCLTLPLGANDPTHLGANDPTTYGQTPPLTGYLEDTFLSLFHASIAKWTFNRKAIGRAFVFTGGMQTKAVECMRWLHKNLPGFSSPEAFNTFLAGCGEYLSLDRDVLSPGKDQRALSPGKWLADWPEQIRLAGIYMDEKAQKITRMPRMKKVVE